jgi:hypothetical protein
MIFIKTDGIPPAAKVDNLGLGIGEYARGGKKKKNQGTCTCKMPPFLSYVLNLQLKEKKNQEKKKKKERREHLENISQFSKS